MKIAKILKTLIITFSILTFMYVLYYVSVEIFEPKAYNYMVNNATAHKTGSDEIVIIAIDDRSVNKIRWPWKRELYSKIFEYLNEYSTARLIGFDATIATPDIENPQSDLKFYSAIKKMNNLVVGFIPLGTTYSNKKDGENYDKMFQNKFSIAIKDETKQKPNYFYQSLSKFPKDYYNSVSKVGSIITTADNDGYIRSIDQVIDYKGRLYPSLSLRMYSALHPEDEFIVKNKSITSTKSGLKIPVFKQYNGFHNNIHYYKPMYDDSAYSHKTYSAIDVIESFERLKRGEKPIISPQVFEDKIVFVGANAKAIAIGLNDIKRTPISGNHPGVDIQATNLDNILHNEFLVQTNLVQDILSMLFILILTFLTIRYFPIFVSFAILALIMASYVLLCWVCYYFNLVISVVTPIVFQIIAMTAAYSYRFFLEGRKKEKIQNAMGKYISKDVMHNVVKNIDDLKLGGKRADVTVLFADIRGFTSMSEKMSAEDVSVILNDYFTEIEPIIAKHNGVINKFIGDAVMAIFGEPIQDKNHAVNAVKCAYDMLKKVDELQAKWLREGKPKIEIGIGINTGEAFVGNIGSEARLEYTVIGDVVNLASRIESYNKVYKTKLLISSSTYEKVRNIADVIKISEVSIRGKAKKLNIYEVLNLVK